VSGQRRRREAGSALVESLVALVLIALAGLIVATAATTGLRATGRAATLTRATGLAGRELARLASTVTAATTDATTSGTLAVTGFVDPVQCATGVTRDGDLVDLTVTVEAGRPAEGVALATRRLTVDGGAP
jgi:Tfp pilus assembly protein PilV